MCKVGKSVVKLKLKLKRMNHQMAEMARLLDPPIFAHPINFWQCRAPSCLDCIIRIIPHGNFLFKRVKICIDLSCFRNIGTSNGPVDLLGSILNDQSVLHCSGQGIQRKHDGALENRNPAPIKLPTSTSQLGRQRVADNSNESSKPAPSSQDPKSPTRASQSAHGSTVANRGSNGGIGSQRSRSSSEISSTNHGMLSSREMSSQNMDSTQRREPRKKKKGSQIGGDKSKNSDDDVDLYNDIEDGVGDSMQGQVVQGLHMSKSEDDKCSANEVDPSYSPVVESEDSDDELVIDESKQQKMESSDGGTSKKANLENLASEGKSDDGMVVSSSIPEKEDKSAGAIGSSGQDQNGENDEDGKECASISSTVCDDENGNINKAGDEPVDTSISDAYDNRPVSNLSNDESLQLEGISDNEDSPVDSDNDSMPRVPSEMDFQLCKDDVFESPLHDNANGNSEIRNIQDMLSPVSAAASSTKDSNNEMELENKRLSKDDESCFFDEMAANETEELVIREKTHPKDSSSYNRMYNDYRNEANDENVNWKKLSRSTKVRSYRDGKPKDQEMYFQDRDIKKKRRSNMEPGEIPSSRSKADDRSRVPSKRGLESVSHASDGENRSNRSRQDRSNRDRSRLQQDRSVQDRSRLRQDRSTRDGHKSRQDRSNRDRSKSRERRRSREKSRHQRRNRSAEIVERSQERPNSGSDTRKHKPRHRHRHHEVEKNAEEAKRSSPGGRSSARQEDDDDDDEHWSERRSSRSVRRSKRGDDRESRRSEKRRRTVEEKEVIATGDNITVKVNFGKSDPSSSSSETTPDTRVVTDSVLIERSSRCKNDTDIIILSSPSSTSSCSVYTVDDSEPELTEHSQTDIEIQDVATDETLETDLRPEIRKVVMEESTDDHSGGPLGIKIMVSRDTAVENKEPKDMESVPKEVPSIPDPAAATGKPMVTSMREEYDPFEPTNSPSSVDEPEPVNKVAPPLPELPPLPPPEEIIEKPALPADDKPAEPSMPHPIITPPTNQSNWSMSVPPPVPPNIHHPPPNHVGGGLLPPPLSTSMFSRPPPPLNAAPIRIIPPPALPSVRHPPPPLIPKLPHSLNVPPPNIVRSVPPMEISKPIGNPLPMPMPSTSFQKSIKMDAPVKIAQDVNDVVDMELDTSPYSMEEGNRTISPSKLAGHSGNQNLGAMMPKLTNDMKMDSLMLSLVANKKILHSLVKKASYSGQGNSASAKKQNLHWRQANLFNQLCKPSMLEKRKYTNSKSTRKTGPRTPESDSNEPPAEKMLRAMPRYGVDDKKKHKLLSAHKFPGMGGADDLKKGMNMKLSEDRLHLLDDVPSSAVELQVKEKVIQFSKFRPYG